MSEYLCVLCVLRGVKILTTEDAEYTEDCFTHINKMSNTVSTFNFGGLKLDGGSMFGAVPKNLWSKLITPDEKNRIQLATRSLVIKSDAKLIIFDTGCGSKWNEKGRAIYDIQYNNFNWNGYTANDVTDVILTHLHFDHAGGVSYYDEKNELQLTYPNAKHWISKTNLELAISPNPREKASYLTENIDILQSAKDLKIITAKTETEILPGISVWEADGHTAGMFVTKVIGHWENENLEKNFFYPADIIPTSHHMSIPYHMGYDMYVDKLLKEKQFFLNKVKQENGIIIFEHDNLVGSVS